MRVLEKDYQYNVAHIMCLPVPLTTELICGRVMMIILIILMYLREHQKHFSSASRVDWYAIH